MYKIYKYSDIDPLNVWVSGDSHGEWRLLEYKIKESGLKDAIILIAGDCGFGFEKPQFYTNTYNKMKKTLTKSNVTLLFIRGNHDDPSYFNEEKIDFKYFKTIPDYSIITVGNDNSVKNILCVGGAISIDRLYRMSRDIERSFYSEIKKKSYWSDECVKYDPEIINKIKADGIDINFVVTHSSPNFVPPVHKYGIEYWIKSDPNLSSDIDKERLILKQIYDHLLIDGHPIKKWFYGHFHEHNIYMSEDSVQFCMLDMLSLKNNSWDILPIIFG